MSMNHRFHNIVRKLKLGSGGGSGTNQKVAARRSIDHEKDKSLEIHPSEVATDYLTSLPPELLFCVTNYLNEIECWCLALTCKSTYSLLTQELKLLQIKDPELVFELLLVLETDLPKFIACQPPSHCSLPFLHTWNNKVTTDPKLGIPEVGCKSSCLATQAQGLRCHNPSLPPSSDSNNKHSQEQPEAPKWYVSEELRRLILRHEILGREYGIPISVLNFQTRSDDKSNVSPSWKTKISAKFTGTATNPNLNNASLMVRRYTSYQTKIFDSRNPYRVPDGEQLRQSLCRHITPDLAILLFRYMIKLLYTHRDTQPPPNSSLWPAVNRPRYPSYPKNWIHHPRLLKCQICATDIYCKSKVRVRTPTPTLSGGGGSSSDPNSNLSKVKVGNGEVEYWSEVVFDVYHDLGGLEAKKPLTRAQKNVVREMPEGVSPALSTAEADERLREALELRWLGRQRSWKDNLTLKDLPRVLEGEATDYTVDGVYAKEGVPKDVCFLKLRAGPALRANTAVVEQLGWGTPLPPHTGV